MRMQQYQHRSLQQQKGRRRCMDGLVARAYYGRHFLGC